ncbi:MAG: hypothetical protein ACUVSY_14615 [Roseiflexus sp.]
MKRAKGLKGWRRQCSPSPAGGETGARAEIVHHGGIAPGGSGWSHAKGEVFPVRRAACPIIGAGSSIGAGRGSAARGGEAATRSCKRAERYGILQIGKSAALVGMFGLVRLLSLIDADVVRLRGMHADHHLVPSYCR